VCALFFVDDHRLFVQRAQRSWLVTTQGAPLASFPTCGRRATSVHGTRLRMAQWIGDEWDWFDEDAYWDASSGRSNVAVLDLDAGEYLERYPADLPQRLLENAQPEDLVAGDVAPVSGSDGERSEGRRGEPPSPLRWGGDRPEVVATTRDARFAWVGGGDDGAVLDLDTGIPQIDPVMQAYVDETIPILRLAPDAEVCTHPSMPGIAKLSHGPSQEPSQQRPSTQ
jgi:hypothetical protein